MTKETCDYTAIKLHSTMDASVWAKEFCRLNPDFDEGTAIAWFANAIMCGYDTAARRLSPKLSAREHFAGLAMQSWLLKMNMGGVGGEIPDPHPPFSPFNWAKKDHP